MGNTPPIFGQKPTALPTPEVSKSREVVEKVKRQWADEIELLDLLTKMEFYKFDSYRKAGFTEQQAMDLLKAEKMKPTL